MGGTKIDLFIVGKSFINFKGKNSDLVSVEFNNLKISQTAWTRTGSIYSSTSILGMNFLSETKLSLFVNPSKREGYVGDLDLK